MSLMVKKNVKFKNQIKKKIFIKKFNNGRQKKKWKKKYIYVCIPKYMILTVNYRILIVSEYYYYDAFIEFYICFCSN